MFSDISRFYLNFEQYIEQDVTLIGSVVKYNGIRLLCTLLLYNVSGEIYNYYKT
jgi:hypothetical protein